MQSDKTFVMHFFEIFRETPKFECLTSKNQIYLDQLEVWGILVSHIGGGNALRRLGKQGKDTNCH